MFKFLFNCLNNAEKIEILFNLICAACGHLTRMDIAYRRTLGGQRKQFPNAALLPHCGKKNFIIFDITAGFRKYGIYNCVLVMCHRIIGIFFIKS